jgi:hypothetical protein
MERRWGTRKAMEVDVVIDNQPAGILRGRIGNVGVGGLFVRTAPTTLSKNAQVELVLMLRQESGTRVYRMPALVARLTPEGAGLMFDQYDVDAFRALVVLLLNRQRRAAADATRGLTKALSLSIDGGPDAASKSEGTRDEAAGAVTSFVSALQQSSPA